MNTKSEIVIRVRKALAEHTGIGCESLEHANQVIFHHLDGSVDKSMKEWFGRRFHTAYQILNKVITPAYDSAPAYVQDLPDHLKDLLFARQSAWVFGGMGMWNDDPAGMAEELGLGEEHRRLSDDLWRYIHKALQYVSNECYT